LTGNVGLTNNLSVAGTSTLTGDVILNSNNNINMGTNNFFNSRLHINTTVSEPKITLYNYDVNGSLHHLGMGVSDVGSTNKSFDFTVPTNGDEFNFRFTGKGGWNGSTGAGLVKILGINGFMGLGTNFTPTHRLTLATDSAAKPNGGSWTAASDQRLKENIEPADLQICYDNIKKLQLKRFRWKDEVYTDEQIQDRKVCGWIAQEVEQIFPKAVSKRNMFGYEDCRDLQDNEIYKALYGTVQLLMKRSEEQQQTIQNLQAELSELKKLAF
jgi:hypothetical protein